MEDLKTFIKNELVNNEIKMYKRVVTYTISDGATRNSIKDFFKMPMLDFEEQSDQSTLAQDNYLNTDINYLKKSLDSFVQNKDLKFDINDFINIYDHTRVGIVLHKMIFSKTKKRMVFVGVVKH